MPRRASIAELLEHPWIVSKGRRRSRRPNVSITRSRTSVVSTGRRPPFLNSAASLSRAEYTHSTLRPAPDLLTLTHASPTRTHLLQALTSRQPSAPAGPVVAEPKVEPSQRTFNLAKSYNKLRVGSTSTSPAPGLVPCTAPVGSLKAALKGEGGVSSFCPLAASVLNLSKPLVMRSCASPTDPSPAGSTIKAGSMTEGKDKDDGGLRELEAALGGGCDSPRGPSQGPSSSGDSATKPALQLPPLTCKLTRQASIPLSQLGL